MSTTRMIDMRKWLRVLVVAIEGMIVVTVVYVEPTHGARGTPWGGAFYDGKPTSWWRQELADWEILESRPAFFGGRDLLYGKRYRASWSERVHWEWAERTQGIVVAIPIQYELWNDGPPLLYGGEAAA